MLHVESLEREEICYTPVPATGYNTGLLLSLSSENMSLGRPSVHDAGAWVCELVLGEEAIDLGADVVVKPGILLGM